MEKTGVVINRDSWLLLQDEPLYSARFIDRDGTDELALVVRVEELEWFVESGFPLSVSFCTWRSSQGVGLAALAYQLYPSFGETKAGLFFLNPRREADAAILNKLPRQEKFAAIFLSADCTTHYTTTLPQDSEERSHWQQWITDLNQAVSDTPLNDDEDPAFEAAVGEFQKQYDVYDVLNILVSS
jgi:hypothetical protein